MVRWCPVPALLRRPVGRSVAAVNYDLCVRARCLSYHTDRRTACRRSPDAPAALG